MRLAKAQDAVMQAKMEKALAVRCPTCGAGPREKCEINSGFQRTDPHPARSLAAEKKKRHL